MTNLSSLQRSLDPWEQEKTNIDHKQLEEYVGTQLANLIDEPKTLIEIDAEIRTASFLVRDEQGRYGFAHTSYGEYFLSRTWLAASQERARRAWLFAASAMK